MPCPPAPDTLRSLIYKGEQMFQIEPGIEMPMGRTKYPFSDMLPGDSIRFVDSRQAHSSRVAALRFVRTHAPDWTFQLRRVDGGWRLWRIA